MKVSLKWLRELVDGTLGADDVAQRLTLAGFEVEGREKFAALSGVVVARVVGKRPHPDATKLTLVDVDDKSGKPTQVVCGAPNVPDAGGLVLWARPGVQLPMGVIAEKAVRGIVSPGMLCAEDELGIGTSHAGILVLSPEDGLAPGDDFNASDEIWELNVTPNRPDALGHVGVAREIAALTGGRLRLPAIAPLPAAGAPAKVELVDAEGCPRFTAVAVDGVRVGPSPLGERLRLQSLGVRAISNVVDATNLMMLLWGQPVHAYDRDKLAGGGLIVRRAKAGEKIVTLDDQERTLAADDVVIADDAAAVGIGGVMGGGTSEVSATTTRLLLECAHFAPSRVRRTAKRLGLHTEASHRFERGTDPNGCAEVARHLAATVLRLAGGQVSSALTDAYPRPIAPTTLELRPARTEALLGSKITRDRQAQLLAAIGLDTVDEGGGHIRVTVPTFRPDLSREVDLIEEIARLHGYDAVTPTLPRLEEPPGPMRDLDDTRNDAARDALSSLGLDEIVSYAFLGPSHGRPFADPTPGGELPHVRVANPVREELSVMRRSLLPGLCLALQRNLARGSGDVRIFEVGAVFLPVAGRQLPDERWYASGLLHGHAEGWLKPGAALDFFDVKGVVEELLRALGHEPRLEPGARTAGLHPNIQAAVYVGEPRVGVAGELHPDAARALGVAGRPLLFELDLQALPATRPTSIGELPRFPSVTRDLSFFVDEGVSAAKIRALVERLRAPLLVDVRVLEEYRGEKRPAGQKGMLWSFTYRAPDRTLTDAEVQKLHDELVTRLGAELSFERR